MKNTIFFRADLYKIFISKANPVELITISESDLREFEGMAILGDTCYNGRHPETIKEITNAILFVDAMDLIPKIVNTNLTEEKKEKLKKIFFNWLWTDCYVLVKR